MKREGEIRFAGLGAMDAVIIALFAAIYEVVMVGQDAIPLFAGKAYFGAITGFACIAALIIVGKFGTATIVTIVMCTIRSALGLSDWYFYAVYLLGALAMDVVFYLTVKYGPSSTRASYTLGGILGGIALTTVWYGVFYWPILTLYGLYYDPWFKIATWVFAVVGGIIGGALGAATGIRIRKTLG